ncbi:hypothetical protein GCM10029963_78750 [Micromonospora andamanensis]
MPGDVSALVARAQAGDVEAFGEIYGRYVDQVHRQVYRRVLDREAGPDLGDVRPGAFVPPARQ